MRRKPRLAGSAESFAAKRPPERVNLLPPEVQRVIIDEAHEGQRIDNFLLSRLKGVPKSRIYRMVREGEVRVNKGRVGVEHRLELGQEVRIPPVRQSDAAQRRPTAPPLASHQLQVIYEDDDLLAVDKPTGLAVHGGSGVQHGVIERLRSSRPEAKFLELVHRIDRETSGVLLIAKRRAALVALHDQLRQHHTEKYYWAVVKGAWPLRSKRIDLPLFKTTDQAGERFVVPRADGIEAVTIVRGVKRVSLPFGDFTLVEARLETGRTHQIRVHMAASGFPIIGDPKYGDFGLNKALEKLGHRRMFLHAARFRYTPRQITASASVSDDTSTPQMTQICAPIPQTFLDLVGPLNDSQLVEQSNRIDNHSPKPLTE